MKRNRRLMRVWLGSALVFGSLVLTSGASAMLTSAGGGGTTPKPVPVAANPGGFNWGIVAIGVAVVLVATAAVAVAQIARNRGRIAASA
jgi:hypothetical protein